MSLARFSARAALGISLLAAFLAFAGQAGAAVYWGNGAPIGRVNLNGSLPEHEFVPVEPFAGGTHFACGGVAVDAAHLYWAEPERDTIARANLDGSGVNRSFIVGADNPCGLAVDGSHVYWANYGSEPMPEFGSGPIGRARLDGSEVDQEFVAGIGRACGVAVDGSHLYWTAAKRRVGRADLDGSDVEAEWIEADDEGCGIAVDAEHVYWSQWDGSIGRADLDGGAANPDFIAGLTRPCGLAIHGSRIFWGQEKPGDSAVASAALDGSTAGSRLVGKVRSACGVAVDGISYALPPPPPPVSEFGFGRVKHKLPAWSAFVAIELPEAGSLRVQPSNGVRVSLRPRPSLGRVAPGRVWAKVSPRGSGAAAELIRKRIKRNGRARVSLLVSFTADGKALTVKRRVLWLLREE